MSYFKMYKLINIIFFITLILKNGCSVYNKENILILVVDDLRPLLKEWGDNITHAPNIDSLAATSVIFKNAFAQQSLCAPSRNSFLTGRRPDTLHLYDFYSYWRNTSGNFTTIPQYFKENGYMSYSFGKVFHPGISSNHTDDYPFSWSEQPYHPSTDKYKDSRVCIDEETGALSRNIICPVFPKTQPEGTLPDIQISQAAIKKLKQHNETFHHLPYFMAIGFHKPHIPLKFPQKYLDFYPIDKILLPKQPFRPPSMPTVAWNPWTDVRERDDISKLNIKFPYGVMPDKWSLKLKQSYYAAVTYIDDLIGDILKHVDMDNTIVVFTSDHGWSLGEHGEWAKYSNFDVALRVPLMIHVPGLTDIHRKMNITNKIVELVGLFPTLAELSGLVKKFPTCSNNHQQLCSEGYSWVSLLDKTLKNISWKHAAFSQYPRPGVHPTSHPNSDKPRLKEIKIMGYTVRTKRYRYTEWVNFNRTSFTPDWNSLITGEFYDHRIDDGENLNLFDRRELNKTILRLHNKLRNGWK